MPTGQFNTYNQMGKHIASRDKGSAIDGGRRRGHGKLAEVDHDGGDAIGLDYYRCKVSAVRRPALYKLTTMLSDMSGMLADGAEARDDACVVGPMLR